MIVQAQELYRFYHTGDDETAALRGVSLTVGHAEIIAVTGPSGSGKSTLLSCITGLDEPDGGRVIVAGEQITRRSEAFRSSVRAQRFGILQQTRNLFQHLTVSENIELQMSLAGSVDLRRVDEILALVELEHRAHGFPDQLSGGETARAGLGVALAADPILLVADEPTAEVDHETEMRLIAHFQKRKLAGKSTLFATHSEALANIADRVVRMRDGKIT